MSKPSLAIASLFGSLLALAFIGVGLTFGESHADARETNRAAVHQGNVGGFAGTTSIGGAGGGSAGTGGSFGGGGGVRP